MIFDKNIVNYKVVYYIERYHFGIDHANNRGSLKIQKKLNFTI
jgi:hypothetical protein